MIPQAVTARKPGAVFICISTLHVLNAIEVRHHWRIPEDQCVLIVLPRIGGGQADLSAAIELVKWNRVIRLQADPVYDHAAPIRERLLQAWRLGRAIQHWQMHIKPFRGCHTLCFPHLNKIAIKRMLAWLRPQHLILIDDGTLSMRLLNSVSGFPEYDPITEFAEFHQLPVDGQALRRRFIFSLFGALNVWHGLLVNGLHARRYTLFSTFAEAAPLGVASVRNTYAWLKERSARRGKSDATVHFLGAPLVERDGVTWEQYSGWLRMVRDAYRPYRFVYYLHPVESDAFGQRISELLSCEVRREVLPYEAVFALSERRPRVVVSWFCSALENILVLSDKVPRVEAFRIPRSEQTDTATFRSARDFYRRYKNSKAIKLRSLSGVAWTRRVSG
ncbi:MAG: hypothetical protein WED00_01050 [Aquisalimonadaceae bacterium]